MSFLFPGALWLAALAIPVIALYFLRQRQQSRKVPTNFLWVEAVRDTRTAAVWRKLLKSLLLLLQLAALLLAVLALAGATAALWSSGSSRFVIAVLDRSASMGVKDGDDSGVTRLAAAKKGLDAAIEGLRDNDRMMLVAVDTRAEILVPFTSEKGRLRAAVERIVVRDLPTDFSDTAVLLRSQREATAGRELEVLLLTDGAFPDPGPLEGVNLSFVPFGVSKGNAGITDVRVVRDAGGEPSLFVSVRNFSPDPVERTVSLRSGETVTAARIARAPASGQAVAVFPTASMEPGAYEVRLDGDDPFPADDVAPFVLRPDPPRRCVVYGEGSRFLDNLLAVRPGLQVLSGPVRTLEALEALGPLDLVIFDRAVPERMPAVRSAIFIACVPPGGDVAVDGALESPPVLDWQRTHPVTRHCEFSPLIVITALRLTGVPRTGVLIDSPEGPLLALTMQGETECLFVPFSLAESNLPLLLAAPLLMANALDRFFAHPRPGDDETVVRTGQPIIRRVSAGALLRVTGPDGIAGETSPAADGLAHFRDTWRVGAYRVVAGEREGLAAAALLSEIESDIAPRETVKAGDVVHVARPEAIDANLLLRDPLLLIVLAVLLLEWWVWTRRPA